MSLPPDFFPKPEIKRISLKSMGASLLAILNLEKGIFYTVWELTKSPGEAMRRYLFVDRTNFIDPLKFLVLTIPIFLFLTFNFFPETSFFSGMEAGANAYAEQSQETVTPVTKVISYLQEYANLLILTMVPISAICTRFYFRSYPLNFAEHLVLNAYIYGLLTFIQIILLPIELLSSAFLVYFTLFLYLFFPAYFFRSFFKKTWTKATLYSILVNVSSFVLSFILLLLLIAGIFSFTRLG